MQARTGIQRHSNARAMGYHAVALLLLSVVFLGTVEGQEGEYPLLTAAWQRHEKLVQQKVNSTEARQTFRLRLQRHMRALAELCDAEELDSSRKLDGSVPMEDGEQRDRLHQLREQVHSAVARQTAAVNRAVLSIAETKRTIASVGAQIPNEILAPVVELLDEDARLSTRVLEYVGELLVHSSQNTSDPDTCAATGCVDARWAAEERYRNIIGGHFGGLLELNGHVADMVRDATINALGTADDVIMSLNKSAAILMADHFKLNNETSKLMGAEQLRRIRSSEMRRSAVDATEREKQCTAARAWMQRYMHNIGG